MSKEQCVDKLYFYYAMLRIPFNNKRKKHFRRQIKHYKGLLKLKVEEEAFYCGE